MVRKNTSLTVDPQLWHQVRVRAAELNIKYWEALDEALHEWLKNHPKPKESEKE